jgi:integrase
MHPEDFLTLDEWHALLKAAQSTRETAILWLLGGAGLHASEVAALKVEHIEFDMKIVLKHTYVAAISGVHALTTEYPAFSSNLIIERSFF